MGLRRGQTACAAVILLGILMQMIGFCAPYWAKMTDMSGTKFSCGLWYYCQDGGSDRQCDPYTWTQNSWSTYYESFYAVHLGVVLATLLSIVVVVLFFAKLLGDDDSATSIGVCGVIAGVLGIIASAVFLGLPVESMNLYDCVFQPHANVYGYGVVTQWAAIIYTVGSGLVLVCSIILFCIPSSDSVKVRDIRIVQGVN